MTRSFKRLPGKWRYLAFVCLMLVNVHRLQAEVVADQDGSSGWNFGTLNQRSQFSIVLSPTIESAYREGQWKQCREELEAVCRLHTNLAPADLIFVWLHLAHGNLSEAKPLLDSLFLRDPDHPEIGLTLGQVAVAEGRFADAIVHLDRAAELRLPNPWSKPEQLSFAVTVLDTKASVYERQQQWSRALESLDKAFALSPQDATRVIRLARAHYELGDRKKSETILKEQAFWAKPPLCCELILARFATQKNDFEEAERLYHIAIANDHDAVQPRLALARFELERRHGEQALETIHQAREQGVNDPQWDEVEGDADMLLGDFEEALKFYDRVIVSEGENANRLLRRSLAMLCCESLDQQQAGKEIAERLAIDAPQNPQTLGVLGFAYFRLGQADLAQPLLSRAIELSPSVPADLAYWMAEVLILDEKTAAAGKQFLDASLTGTHGLFLMHHRAINLAAKAK